jgi:hypothetical protein
LSRLTLPLVGPSAAEVGVQASVLFVFQMALVGGAFGAGARSYGDAKCEGSEGGFEDGFHGVCFLRLVIVVLVL